MSCPRRALSSNSATLFTFLHSLYCFLFRVSASDTRTSICVLFCNTQASPTRAPPSALMPPRRSSLIPLPPILLPSTTTLVPIASLRPPVSNHCLVFQLVSGLTDAYRGVATPIRQSNPLPALNQALSLLTLEETGLAKLLNNSSHVAMHTTQQWPSDDNQGRNGGRGNRDGPRPAGPQGAPNGPPPLQPQPYPVWQSWGWTASSWLCLRFRIPLLSGHAPLVLRSSQAS